MTSSVPSPLDALEGFLEERRRYEGWLSQLETRRGAAPPHVLERVRIDYEQRLVGVTEQLRSRAAELEASAHSLKERVHTLQSEENERRDERAETELRAAVGEYVSDHADDMLRRLDEAINRLSGERGALQAELTRIEEVLALVRRPGVEVPIASLAPDTTAEHPRLPTDADAAAAFEELAFLQSVVQPREAPAAAAPAGDGHSEPESASMTQSVATEQENDPAAAAYTVPQGTPAFLKEVAGEQVKTLKCQECGTMNYATEWYCERCGGELAAL